MDANRILKYSRRRCRSSVAIASVSFRNFFFCSQSGDRESRKPLNVIGFPCYFKVQFVETQSKEFFCLCAYFLKNTIFRQT